MDAGDKSGVEEVERLFSDKFSVESEGTEQIGYAYYAAYRVRRTEEKILALRMLEKIKGAKDGDPSSTQTAQKYDRAAMDQSRHSGHARQRPIPGGLIHLKNGLSAKQLKSMLIREEGEALESHRKRKSRMTGR